MQTGVRTEQAVARAFARAADSAEAYGLALQAIGESLGWPFGAAWEPAPGLDDVDVLRCVATWSLDGRRTASFDEATRDTELSSGRGLPGRVWQHGNRRGRRRSSR